jgi:hypothetical protein
MARAIMNELITPRDQHRETDEKTRIVRRSHGLRVLRAVLPNARCRPGQPPPAQPKKQTFVFSLLNLWPASYAYAMANHLTWSKYAQITRIVAALWIAPAISACADTSAGSHSGADEIELEFGGEQRFLPGFDFDSGWLPNDSPVAVRSTVIADGGVTVVALATTDGETMTPVAGSGALVVQGSLAFEVSARIDTNGLMYEGIVDSFEYAIEPANAAFDPFEIDTIATVTSMLPPAELGRVPIPSVPGATLVVDVTGGEITTAFEGTCAEALDGYGQYTGAVTMQGVVGLAATIEIEIPIVGTQSFGPFPIDVPIPAIETPMDLGTRSLATGEAADAMGICEGDAATTSASTGGSTGDSSTEDGELDTSAGSDDDDASTSLDGGSDGSSSSDGAEDTGDSTACSDDATCASATVIGEVQGDEVSEPLELEGTEPTWVSFQVLEENDSVVGEALSFSATLTSPVGYDFDLYVYRGPEGGATGCGGELEQSTSAGASDVVQMSWGEGIGANAQNDSAWVAVEIVAKDGICDENASWTLTIDGGM